LKHAEQSNRINLPDISKPQTLDEFINSNEVNLVFTDLNSKNKKLDKSKFDDKPICVLVGPEGDFSEEEREKILNYNRVFSIKINDNILRSETAVISSLSIVNYAIS
jgi:16S rRNA (uracil1498-N3)-methyltransferase